MEEGGSVGAHGGGGNRVRIRGGLGLRVQDTADRGRAGWEDLVVAAVDREPLRHQVVGDHRHRLQGQDHRC